MLKKLILTITILILCALICFFGYKNIAIKIETKGGIKGNGFTYVMANNNGRSEFSYSFNLTNTNGKDIFIKSIEPSINETMKNNILSNENIIVVNKNIKPNETIQINGKVFINTSGLSMYNIGKLITNIKVSTEEIVTFN
jgi:hypothetical protein